MTVDMRSFLRQIKKTNDLFIVKKRVSTKYEIAAVTAKLDGSKAALFENIKGSKFRLVSNLVGNRTRFGQAIGFKKSDINQKIVRAISSAKKPKISAAAKFFENSSKDISILPIITHFQNESGPFITSSILYAQNQEKKSQNSSFHRLMPIGKNKFSIRMVEGRDLHRSFMFAKNHGEDLSIAITIGVHPAISIASAFQAEWGKNELEIANSLLNNKLTLTKCPSTGLLVPSTAEIVMEGKILQDKTHKEWMVEMLQTYDMPRAAPVIEIEKLYFRNNPIYHDILSGYSEARLLMGIPIEAKLDGIMKKRFPQTKQVVLTDGGANWLHAVIQISKTKSTNVKKIIKEMFANHRSLKMVTVVDDDIDPTNAISVEFAMATRFQADKDLVIIKNVRGSSLDPSSDQKKLRTAKMGIDATIPPTKRSVGFKIGKILKVKTPLKNYSKK
ncbi:MAG: UbiD family decarboxylase [Nitrosopumilus sp. YT1]|nr:MAG: UbiD family decarboxylase [Nitrosopumilus sp. YT1]